MRACFPCPSFGGDLKLLCLKYPSIYEDIRFLTTYMRTSRVHSERCTSFNPDIVLRTGVQITGLPWAEAQDRCTLVYEIDGAAFHLLLLYDNDVYTYEEMIPLIASRR